MLRHSFQLFSENYTVFPNHTHHTYRPSRIPQFAPQDLLKAITVTITRLFPADVPHLPPFETLLMSSRTATGWHLLKLCSHCDLTHWDGKKPIFCSAGALLSSHSSPNYQLRLSSPRLHFAATAVALLPFSSQTNFERLSKTVDRKCHRIGEGSSSYWSLSIWFSFNPADRNCDVLSAMRCTVYWQHYQLIFYVFLLFWVW